jgi:hypothetical protein
MPKPDTQKRMVVKMAYVDPNFKTKKALKEAIAALNSGPIGERREHPIITVYQPNGDLTGAQIPDNGTVYLEGPHYPQPHTWYAQGTMKDGKLVKIK